MLRLRRAKCGRMDRQAEDDRGGERIHLGPNIVRMWGGRRSAFASKRLG